MICSTYYKIYFDIDLNLWLKCRRVVEERYS
jgi:hypothetical protein